MFSLEDTRLILSDVDETIAGVYLPATDNIVEYLDNLLNRQIGIILVSGQSKENIYDRLVGRLSAEHRKQILVCECSGAAIWRFKPDGSFNEKPLFSLYEQLLSGEQQLLWRAIVASLVDEFKFNVLPAMPKEKFIKLTNRDQYSVMLDDRESQITFELINCEWNRARLIERSNELFALSNLPIESHKAGTFAVDLTLLGVSKFTAVKRIMEDDCLLQEIGVTLPLTTNQIMVWGDKFSLVNGGTDMHILYALDPSTPVIDFRDEPSSELDSNYNIRIWIGNESLHFGLEEYLRLSLDRLSHE